MKTIKPTRCWPYRQKLRKLKDFAVILLLLAKALLIVVKIRIALG